MSDAAPPVHTDAHAVAADFAADLELAAQLVYDAGHLARRMRTTKLNITTKTTISDIVTNADHAAEKLITQRLADVRPQDGLLGEEGTRRTGDRQWIIDPIDGTHNYVHGLPHWCSAVALVQDEGSILGAIYQPDTDEMWLGGLTHPTTRNNVATPPIADAPLANLSVATNLTPATLCDPAIADPLLTALTGAACLRMIGSSSIELAALAAGQIGVYLHLDVPPWDWAPGAALVTAAGGYITTITAHNHRWHIAGNHTAVDELVTIIAKETVG